MYKVDKHMRNVTCHMHNTVEIHFVLLLQNAFWNFSMIYQSTKKSTFLQKNVRWRL